MESDAVALKFCGVTLDADRFQRLSINQKMEIERRKWEIPPKTNLLFCLLLVLNLIIPVISWYVKEHYSEVFPLASLAMFVMLLLVARAFFRSCVLEDCVLRVRMSEYAQCDSPLLALCFFLVVSLCVFGGLWVYAIMSPSADEGVIIYMQLFFVVALVCSHDIQMHRIARFIRNRRSGKTISFIQDLSNHLNCLV